MSEKRMNQVIKWHEEEVIKRGHLPWVFDDEMWSYLIADVEVGQQSMEAYHKFSLEIHEKIWVNNESMRGLHVSPLGKGTSPGWALQLYQTWFLPANIATLKNAEAKFIRESLRGGRTDKRCNYIELTPQAKAEGCKIMYYDFKSLYPSVQKCDIHGTHFPVGPPQWARGYEGITNNQQLIDYMGDKTGFLRIDTIPLKYVTHPTLHRVGSRWDDGNGVKLLFENRPHEAETYGWPEILEAIESGEVQVTRVYEGVLFDKGTDTFNAYVDQFFAIKDEAEERVVDGVLIKENQGMRSLAKLLLNSLWGKLGQRSYSTREWVSDTVRLDDILEKLENKEYKLVGMVEKMGKMVYMVYDKPEDLPNLTNTAHHVAAFVSMWGRVILHRKLLRQHGMRALYCDTDSAIVYLRPNDAMPWTGDKIGDLTNEVKKLAPKHYKNPYIQQSVFLAPKSYGMRINADDLSHSYDKITLKGFVPSYANSKVIHYRVFKNLVFTQYRLNSLLNNKRPFEHDEHINFSRQWKAYGKESLAFKSSIATGLGTNLRPVEARVSRTTSAKYDKGEEHIRDRRFIQPYCSLDIIPPEGTFFDKVDGEYVDYE